MRRLEEETRGYTGGLLSRFGVSTFSFSLSLFFSFLFIIFFQFFGLGWQGGFFFIGIHSLVTLEGGKEEEGQTPYSNCFFFLSS